MSSIIRLHNLSSIFKKIQNKSKCGDNKKITIITTQSHLTKSDVFTALKNYANFITKESTIDFTSMKINSVNYSEAKLNRKNYFKNNKFIMTNLYSKVDKIKKFIITFKSFNDKVKFTEIFEL